MTDFFFSLAIAFLMVAMLSFVGYLVYLLVTS